MNSDQLTIGICQIAPVWLNKAKTLDKILTYLQKAANDHCDLAVFGECLLPGYPFWLEHTDGARFNSPIQKDIYAHYFKEAVEISNGDLDPVCAFALNNRLAVYLGCLERAADRGGHSLYCSLVYINEKGEICSSHRKLMPTHEERLVWSIGDGHGLTVHPLKHFHLGGLNCWENWMPLARASLYAQGENVHVAVWPGNLRNTRDLTRHIALESRSFSISVSGIMTKADINREVPHAGVFMENAPEVLADGGSCIAAPDGTWIIEPIVGREAFASATIDLNTVRRERQNFDPSGHYSRPDVFQLQVDRTRQSIIKIREGH